MKKFNLNVVSLLAISASLLSCDSNNENPTNEKTNESAVISKMLSGTRKAILLTSTDTQTGQVTTLYDCTQEGNNCDISKPLNKSLSDNKIINDLPLFNNEIIKKNIDNKTFSLNKNSNYIELIDNKNSNVLFVYSFTNNVKNNASDRLPEPVFKKAVIDTETNTVRCNEDGKNCRVSAISEDFTEGKVNNKAIQNENVLTLFNNLYPNENIFKKDYTKFEVKKYNNALRLDIPNGKSLFYVQK